MGSVIVSLSQAGIGLLTMTPLVVVAAVVVVAWTLRRRGR
jgi:cyanate permease